MSKKFHLTIPIGSKIKPNNVPSPSRLATILLDTRWDLPISSVPK